MDINVYDLDNAYEQCAGLHDLVVREYGDGGQELINRLESNIASLRINWIGQDATVQINNLIKVHDALVALVTDAKAVISDAADRIIAIQKVRNSNGASNKAPGEALDGGAPKSEAISQVPDTEEFYVKPEAANDSTELNGIYEAYGRFVEDLKGKKEELFGNWTAGANIDVAKGYFQTFIDNSAEYNSYLQNAKTDLETAVSNMSQL